MFIKIINLDKCIKEFGNIGDIDLKPALTLATRKVQATAKQLAPKDTGILEGSIRTSTFKSSGVVYTNTEYAPYQEFGTSKMKAQPFMIPAMKLNDKWIKDLFKNYLKREMRKEK
jgi:HK97 gp10 family phage protein